MKQFKLLATLIAAFSTFVLVSCGSGDSEKKTEEKTDTSAVKPAETTPETKPEAANPNALTNVVIVKHKVANYAKWKVGYDAHDSARMANGLSSFLIGRGTLDSNTVLVVLRASDTAKARQFRDSPGLKDAMKKGGVIGQPSSAIVNVVWSNPANVDQPQNLMVTHKVKDFDAWRKVFDDGKQTRSDLGIIDLGIGRNANDPQIVTVVFAINDMAKAKAFMASKDLKDKMAAGGVQGAPSFFFYKVAQSY